MTPGPTQLIIVLVIVLLLFGAKKIPELAKGLGTGMREFRQGASGELEDDDKDKNKENKSDKETSSESHDAHSEDEITYSSDETSKTQNADKTEQRS